MTRKHPPQQKGVKTIPLPLRRSKYQIFPALSPDRHEALKASLASRGQDDPIVCDRQGNIVDGWERAVCCQELGVEPTREVRDFQTEAEKFQFALAVNAHRRQCLSGVQKRTIIEAYLQGDPHVADNLLGQALGVSKNTVLKVRQHLEAKGDIPKVEKTRGKDGKLRPVRFAKRIITNSRKEFDKARAIIEDLPDTSEGKTHDIITAQRRARRNKKKTERQGRIIKPLPSDAIQLYHCRFQDLEKKASIKPESVKLILTDMPYDEEFVPELNDLADFANRVLVKGGLFVSVCGGVYLNKVILTFEDRLKWCPPIGEFWDGDANMIWAFQAANHWKPIVIYSKGKWVTRDRWGDVLHVKGKEKQWHEWQQPLEGVMKLLANFSQPGDLVVDCLAGGFTTAEACLRLGRRCISCEVEAKWMANGQKRLALARKSLRARA